MSRHHSPHSVIQRASTGTAIRRGQLKISDPIPMASAHASVTVQPSPAFERVHSRKAGTWSGGLTHGRSPSASPFVADETENALSEPVSPPCPSPSIPLTSPSSKKRETGLRATLKRILSTKRGSAGKVFDPAARNASTERFASSVQTGSSSTTSPLIVPVRKHSLPLNLLPLHESTQDMSFVGSPLPKVEEENYAPVGRRNTIPSLVMTNDELGSILQHVSGRELLNRPTTAIRHVDRGNTQLKRKSKSADDIPDILQGSNTDYADRQDRMSEIAFWRNTVITNPIPVWTDTEAHSEADLTTTDRSVLMDSTIPSTEPLQSMQNFDFGLVGGNSSAPTASLDDRVNTLEVKMIDFEYALANLQGNELPRPLFDYKESLRPRLPTENFQDGTFSDVSPPSTDLSSTTSSPRKRGSNLDDKFDSPDRTSKATIKATARQTSIERQGSAATALIRASQYEALLALVRTEQSARQMLEMQILTLRKEMEALQRPMQGGFRSNAELTPSPDSLYNSSVVTRTRLSQHSPPFYGSAPFQETSRFSMTESDLETETDYYPEVFETPQETRFPPHIQDEPFSFGMI